MGGLEKAWEVGNQGVGLTPSSARHAGSQPDMLIHHQGRLLGWKHAPSPRVHTCLVCLRSSGPSAMGGGGAPSLSINSGLFHFRLLYVFMAQDLWIFDNVFSFVSFMFSSNMSMIKTEFNVFLFSFRTFCLSVK